MCMKCRNQVPQTDKNVLECKIKTGRKSLNWRLSHQDAQQLRLEGLDWRGHNDISIILWRAGSLHYCMLVLKGPMYCLPITINKTLRRMHQLHTIMYFVSLFLFSVSLPPYCHTSLDLFKVWHGVQAAIPTVVVPTTANPTSDEVKSQPWDELGRFLILVQAG